MKKFNIIFITLLLAITSFAQTTETPVVADNPKIIKMNNKITSLLTTKEKLIAENVEFKKENEVLKIELKQNNSEIKSTQKDVEKKNNELV